MRTHVTRELQFALASLRRTQSSSERKPTIEQVRAWLHLHCCVSPASHLRAAREGYLSPLLVNTPFPRNLSPWRLARYSQF